MARRALFNPDAHRMVTTSGVFEPGAVVEVPASKAGQLLTGGQLKAAPDGAAHGDTVKTVKGKKGKPDTYQLVKAPKDDQAAPADQDAG